MSHVFRRFRSLQPPPTSCLSRPACLLLLLSGLLTKEPPDPPPLRPKKPKNIYSVQTYLLALPLNSAPLLIWLLITRIRHSILQERIGNIHSQGGLG